MDFPSRLLILYSTLIVFGVLHPWIVEACGPRNIGCKCDNRMPSFFSLGYCEITEGAPAGQKCSCHPSGYKKSVTGCYGIAVPCASNEVCPHLRADKCACLMALSNPRKCGFESRFRFSNYMNELSACDRQNHISTSSTECDCSQNWLWSHADQYNVLDTTISTPIISGNAKVTYVGSIEVRNTASITQSSTRLFVDRIETETSFSRTEGIEIGVGTQFKAPLPGVQRDGTLSVNAAYTNTWTYGRSNRNAAETRNSYVCIANSHTHTKCLIYNKKYTAEADYVMTARHNYISNCQCTSKGKVKYNVHDVSMDVQVVGSCCSLVNLGQCVPCEQ